MNKVELKAFFDKAQADGKPCKLIYYCKASKGSFSVKTLDADGKYIHKQHPVTGTLLLSKGQPVLMEQHEHWDLIVPTRTAKANALCFKSVQSDEHGVFTPYQKEMIAVLERMCDTLSTVMRESEYKQEKNPDAWAREKELQELKASHSSKVEKAHLIGVEEGKAEALTTIDRLREQLAAAEQKVSQALEGAAGKPEEAQADVKPQKKGRKQ